MQNSMLERLKRAFRRRNKGIAVFQSVDAYLRLLAACVVKYIGGWQNMGSSYIDASFLQNYVR